MQNKDWNAIRKLFREIRKVERAETQKSQLQRKEDAVWSGEDFGTWKAVLQKVIYATMLEMWN